MIWELSEDTAQGTLIAAARRSLSRPVSMRSARR